ncbi:MAG TPA: nitronate monooxygenase [Stellaceae bacterium]|nr:nitronate monooxygenase [Stellaceae bacterium]
MALRTRLSERLGIRHPVLLAPMGFVSGGALAAAVSAAGGLGIIGGGYADPDWLEGELVAAGNQRVGCGFITWALARRSASLDLALRRSPAAVMLSFGDAAPFLPRIKQAGALAICQVQSVRQARQVLGEGADIIVAQGSEAGGHGSTRSTFPLVPAVVDMVAQSGRDALVVAAGGVADGRGLAAALMLGADGVLIGTRFLAAEESLAAPAAKARVVAASGDDTLRTTVFDLVRGYEWPPEYTGRALVNRFSQTWHGREEALAAAGEAERAHYGAAAAAGDVGTAVVFAGEDVDLIHSVEPAGVILERIIREAEAALARRFD